MPLALLSDIAADGEAGGAEGLVALHDGVAPGHGHVVHHPLLHVVLMDPISKKLEHGFFILGVLPPTDLRIRLILLEVNLRKSTKRSASTTERVAPGTHIVSRCPQALSKHHLQEQKNGSTSGRPGGSARVVPGQGSPQGLCR